tara:strand:- start:4114 stop:4698 length:585 start_codon:yes stop_codon:yes gene_type:complete
MINFDNKKVAVVGSSGHLLERDYASLIDGHDYVIRFNQARVEGYEKFVGSKTTHRIVNVHTFLGTTGNDRFPKNDPMFIPKQKNQHIIVNRSINLNQIKQRSPNNEVSIIPTDFWEYCKGLLNNQKHPSVGFLGTILAVQTSKNVNIFGFDQSPTTSKKHYWEDVRAIGSWHNFTSEKEYFSLLEQENFITLYT